VLISHTFDHANHIYLVPNEYVWSTGDVIQMNGLSDFSQVPIDNLRYATDRGTGVHLAIQAYEQDEDVQDVVRQFELENDTAVMDGVMERMKGYFRFRDTHDLKLCGEMEQTRVYQHLGTEILIGGTIDIPCMLDGRFTILDPKTCFKQYGQAAKQTHLKWRMQLQSYREAMEADTDFWTAANNCASIDKCILHLHPNCGKERGSLPLGYELHAFNEDESHLWDSMIRIGQAKLSAGFKLEKKL
jgi:hypothetical protein